MELQSGVKIAAKCVISKYEYFVHQRRRCYRAPLLQYKAFEANREMLTSRISRTLAEQPNS